MNKSKYFSLIQHRLLNLFDIFYFLFFSVPEKIAADPEKGSLVYFGYTDVGVLNTVIELWRYPSAGSCMRARQAARTVPAWRETIGAVTPGVQHFRSIFMNPLPFSPLQ